MCYIVSLISPSSTDMSLCRRLCGRVATLSAVVGVIYLWVFTPLSVPALVGTASRDGLAVAATLSRIPKAVAIVREERRRTAAEQDAFEQFAKRVASLEPSRSGAPASDGRAGATTDGPVAVSVAESSTGVQDASMEAVRDAYRETVMAVPHYEEEYDEPLVEYMAKEFGTDLAKAVTSADALTPQLRAALIESSAQAREERANFLRRLDGEYEDVADARATLQDVNDAIETVEDGIERRSMPALQNAWTRLEELEAECKNALHDRQSQLHEARFADSNVLQKYLYDPEPWTYPVLGDDLDCLDRIADARRRVTDVVARKK